MAERPELLYLGMLIVGLSAFFGMTYFGVVPPLAFILTLIGAFCFCAITGAGK